MAEQETPAVETDETESTTGGRTRLLGLMAVTGFVLFVVLVECAVAYFVFPSKEEVALMAQAKLAIEGQAEGEVEAEIDPDAPDDFVATVEVELGEFGVTSYQPETNSTLRIDFRLFGIVLEDDGDEFKELLEENRHRYREQVLVILRSSDMTDLTDAGLGLIKRKILEKTNRTLGKALLQEVIFSDFSFVEQ